MKKLFLVIILFTLTLNAQEEYGTYTVGGEEISSSINLEDGKIYIDIEADGSYGLILTQKQRNSFKLFLEESRIKFKEWEATAIENDVKDMNKDIKSTSHRGIFSYGGWKFGTSNLRTMMWIEEDGRVKFYLYGGKITSSTNKYIKSKSTLLNLTSKDDFDSMINILSDETINDFKSKKTKNDDLFKN
jgi:hypothetical protein